MDICKGEKSQDTLGTEGTRVHQVTNEHQQWTKGTLGTERTRVHQGTDEHLQRRKVSRYTRYRRDKGTPSYK